MSTGVYTLRAENPASESYCEMAAMLTTLGFSLAEGCSRVTGDGYDGEQTVWRYAPGGGVVPYGIGEAISRGLCATQAGGPQRVIALGYHALRRLLRESGRTWRETTEADEVTAALNSLGVMSPQARAAFLDEYHSAAAAEPENLSVASALSCAYYNLRELRRRSAELPLMVRVAQGHRSVWLPQSASEEAWNHAERFLLR